MISLRFVRRRVAAAKSENIVSRLRLLSVCVVSLLLVGAASAQQQVDAAAAGFSPDKLAKLRDILKTAIEKKQISGGSTLVARRGKLIHVNYAGQQDIEGKVPVSDSTIFRIASMSKPITSVAILTLIEDGKISPTDPLNKFAPEFKEMKVLVPSKDGKTFELVNATREITIHDLLTHTSGITYGLINKPFVSKMYGDAGVSDGLVENPGAIGDNVKKLAKMPLVCQPGEAWEYGLNTDVLGYVVEVASGKTLEQYLSERIFQPLKMNDTCFILAKDKHARLAALYDAAPGKDLQRVTGVRGSGAMVYSATYPTNENGKYYSGGGGLVSTLNDYYRFCQMMLNGGELDGARVLKADTVKMATQNQIGKLRVPFPGSNAMGYGFGILTEEGKAQTKDLAGAGTYTWAGAFSTYFWIDPKNELVGILMTQVSPPNFMLSIEFKRRVYEAMTDAK